MLGHPIYPLPISYCVRSGCGGTQKLIQFCNYGMNKARNDSGSVVANTADQKSDTMTMVRSGARGNLINLAQIAACVGQQALRGGRINKGYEDRTLSCFKKNDLGPEAHGFITELPEGYNTIVGDKGMKLSGGQGQRIAIARAIIREPELLIFDEATNALDNISEAAVQRAIAKVSKNHTVIVVAHRLSTIRSADVILVIDEGKIAEQGNHRALIQQKGRYYELYTSQFAEEQTSEILGHGAE